MKVNLLLFTSFFKGTNRRLNTISEFTSHSLTNQNKFRGYLLYILLIVHWFILQYLKKMWKTLVFEGNYYLFKVISANEEVTIYISDLQSIWRKQTSNEHLQQIFKQTNTLLDHEAPSVHNIYLLMLNEKNLENLTFDADSNECSLKFKYFIDELPVKLNIKLQKQAGTDYLNQITIPLVQTVQYLEFKQKKLETLLCQKDKELSEYKFEYGKISRKILNTEKYEADREMKTNLVLKVFSEDNDFNRLFAEKHGDIQQLFPEIKEEKKPEKRKLELAPSKYKKTK